jgi:predicted CXXCH cytochrome family protein
MKKFLFLGIGSALMFTMGGVGPAQADNGPHISTAATAAGDVTINTAAGAGRCAACHRAHTAKAKMLLKEAQPALCYTCHGGGAGANTDVQNGTSGIGGALRGGGFETALIQSDNASKHMEPPTTVGGRWVTTNTTVPVINGSPKATTSSHQIDGVTSGTIWGNGAISSAVNLGKAAVTLECGSCHDPHGNGNYRILKPVPNDATPVAILVKAAVPAVVDDPATTTVDETKAAVRLS